MSANKLTAENLKKALWDEKNKIISGEMKSETARASAAHSREIMRIIRTELQANDWKPTEKLKEFLG